MPKDNIDSNFGDSPFIGGEAMDDLELTPEEIAIRDGEPLPSDDPADPPKDGEQDDDPADPPKDGEQDDDPADPAKDGEQDDDPADPPKDGEEDDDPADPPKDDDPEPQDKKPSVMVPKSRLDNALKRAQRAEEQLKRQQQSRPAANESKPEAFDPEALELEIDAESVTKMFDAAIDGKAEDAHKLFATNMTSIVKKALGAAIPSLREEMRHEMSTSVTASLQDSAVEQSFDDAVAEVYETFPFMNPDSDQLDKAILEDAVAFQQGYEARGMSPGRAVLEGARKAVQLHRPEALQDQEDNPPPPAPPPADKSDKKSRERNAEAARAQPPRLDAAASNKGKEADEVNIDQLTDEEFDALPEATKSRLRGDAA